MPNRLRLQRHVVKRESIPSNKDDTVNDDELNFGAEFFATLESYFLECEQIRAANLDYKNGEGVLESEASSFLRPKLNDAFENQSIDIIFFFAPPSEAKRT
jgi:hypothetical protein